MVCARVSTLCLHHSLVTPPSPDFCIAGVAWYASACYLFASLHPPINTTFHDNNDNNSKGLTSNDINTRDFCIAGIAWDTAARRLFVTGKWWPAVFEVKPRPFPPGEQPSTKAVNELCQPKGGSDPFA